MPRKRNVIFFDLDNTLYPADTIYDLGLRAAWRSSPAMSWSSFFRLYRRARADVKTLAGTSPSIHNRALYFKRFSELYHGGVSSALALRLIRAYDGCWSKIDLGPTRTLLTHLSKHFKLGLITNQVGLTQLQKMERIDPAGRLFPVMVTSEEVNAEKPSPKIFRVACQRMGCRPSEAYMVGDNWNDDVKGALRAGIKPIYLSQHPPTSLSGKIILIRSLHELPRVLGLPPR